MKNSSCNVSPSNETIASIVAAIEIYLELESPSIPPQTYRKLGDWKTTPWATKSNLWPFQNKRYW